MGNRNKEINDPLKSFFLIAKQLIKGQACIIHQGNYNA